MSLSALVEESDLHALVDGELDPDRRRKVEDHLLQHPEDAALVEAWRRQNAALRAAFEAVAQETPPLSLRGAATRRPAPPPGQRPIETGAVHWGRPSGSARSVRRLDEIRQSRRRQAIVSSALALVAGAAVAAAGLFAFTKFSVAPRPAVVSPVTQGYAARAGVTFSTYAADERAVEIDAGRREELAAWLRGRAGFGRLPDLSGLGLRLLGGRVAPGVAGPAGFLLYQTAAGERLGLYFERVDAGGAAPHPFGAPPRLAAIEWRSGNMAFVLIGSLSPEAMQAAAERAASETRP